MIGTSELVLGDTTDVSLRQPDIQISLLSQQWLQGNASAISN